MYIVITTDAKGNEKHFTWNDTYDALLFEIGERYRRDPSIKKARIFEATEIREIGLESKAVPRGFKLFGG